MKVLQTLPERRRHAIEFREPSWYTEEVFTLLTRYHVALCLHDMRGSASGRRRVGPFVYVRFHGTERYSGSYTDAHLDEWAAWIAAQLADHVDVYAYFNNDVGGHAPRDATRLRTAVERHTQSQRVLGASR